SGHLPADDVEVLRKQHLALAKFADGVPVICGYDGRYLPCVAEGYIQSSPTDFDRLTRKLPGMRAVDVAKEARASMQRYIAVNGKQATMGGEFSAALLMASGI